jgi:hypothetical protein
MALLIVLIAVLMALGVMSARVPAAVLRSPTAFDPVAFTYSMI